MVTDEQLLGVLLRSRPESIHALARITSADVDVLRDRVEGLAAAGHLMLTRGGRIVYASPAEAASARLRELSTTLRTTAEATLAGLLEMADSLPQSEADWMIGEAATRGRLPIEVFHGENAAAEMWTAHRRRHSGGADMMMVFPGVERLADRDPDALIEFVESIVHGGTARAILPAGSAARGFADRVERYRDIGVEFRTLVDPPGWFWLEHNEALALPLQSGEGWPTDLMLVRSPVIARLARAHFDELWSRAQPIDTVERSWTPLLRLMRQGATLETASRMIGVNPRTGRRRAAAAMSHYGVSTLFGLGAAWGADVSGASGAAGERRGS